MHRFSFFLLLAAGLLAAMPSRAIENNLVVTIESVYSTSTIATVTIASVTTTDIVISTVPLYRQVCVQNLSQTSYLACSENVNVSSTPTDALFGVEVSSGGVPLAPICLPVVAGQRFYCRSSGTTQAAHRAAIHRKR